MAQIYSSPSYAMGAVDEAATQKQAERSLKQMQRGLKKWLKVRKRMNEYAAGKVKAKRMVSLPSPVVAATLRQERFADEQDLAETLYALLTECGADPAALPEPNVAKDQNAAAKLALIAIQGKTPSEVKSHSAQGIAWFVLAIPIGGIVLVLSQAIKSKADLAAQKEENRCIESGACTDSGFWLKVASVSVIAWILWDKVGLKEAAQGALKSK